MREFLNNKNLLDIINASEGTPVKSIFNAKIEKNLLW